MNIKNKSIISFDVWNTLLTPNPEFKSERNFLLARTLGCPQETVEYYIKMAKSHLDWIQENTGKAFTTLECWEFFCHCAKLDKGMGWNLMLLSNAAFKRNKPIFDEQLIHQIKILYDVSDANIVLVSNTNFVSGDLVFKEVFQHHYIFDEAAFSDEYGVAKPCKELFDQVYCGEHGERIVHIGDNPITDGIVEEHYFGADYVHVNNPSETIEVVKGFIKEITD